MVTASLFWKGGLAATVALEATLGCICGSWPLTVSEDNICFPSLQLLIIAILNPKCKFFLNHFSNQPELLSKVMALQKKHTNQNSLLTYLAMNPGSSSLSKHENLPLDLYVYSEKEKYHENHSEQNRKRHQF